MTTTLLQTNEELAEWDLFASKHLLGTIYHTSAWARAVNAAYGPLFRILAVRNSDNELVGGVPLYEVKGPLGKVRFVSAACSQQCDILARSSEDESQILRAVWDEMDRRKAKAWELRATTEKIGDETVRRDASKDFCTHCIDLEKDTDDIFNTLHKKDIRLPLSRAEKGPLRVRRETSEESVRTFWRLYAHMRHEKGLLTQPYRFFQALWKEFAQTGALEVVQAVHSERVVSSLLLLKYGDKVFAEYGATLPGERRHNGSPLLYWTAIQNAKNKGYRYFDFGRTNLSNDGLVTYKDKWGGERVQLYYCKWPSNTVSSHIRQHSLLKTAMYYTVRNTPSFTGRALGSVLYPYLI